MNYGKLCSLSIKSSIMRISGSLTFLDASVGGYNLETNERMNIVESANRQRVQRQRFWISNPVDQELSVPRALHVQHTCFALKVLIGLSLPSGMQFTSTFENAEVSSLTRVHWRTLTLALTTTVSIKNQKCSLPGSTEAYNPSRIHRIRESSLSDGTAREYFAVLASWNLALVSYKIHNFFCFFLSVAWSICLSQNDRAFQG